jgi:hypothetical protein
MTPWRSRSPSSRTAIALNSPDPNDPVDVLAKVGGAEIGGIAGLVLGAASLGIPVVIDGLISTAGAIIAWAMEPATADYMFAAHNSVEKGHRVMLEKMGLEPILNMGLRLGEGTGPPLPSLSLRPASRSTARWPHSMKPGCRRSWREHMKRILIAFQFLTIIPIRIGGRLSENDISLSAVFFPLVGFVQGVVLAAAAFFSLKVFSPAVTSLLIMAVYLLSNGAFHQDGLSDTVDALSVKSTGDTERDREKRLAVMRDPTAGPVGVVAIVAAILFKYVLILRSSGQGEHSLLNPVVLLMPAVAAWTRR